MQVYPAVVDPAEVGGGGRGGAGGDRGDDDGSSGGGGATAQQLGEGLYKKDGGADGDGGVQAGTPAATESPFRGELDRYAGWHKVSHPTQKLQRLLDYFAMHSSTKETSMYSRAILWLLALRLCLCTIYLCISPTVATSQYSYCGVIVVLWQLLCLLVQATMLYKFRTDSLIALYTLLCTDDTYPDLSVLLRNSLASSLRRLTPIVLAVIVGNTVFLVFICSGFFSYFFPLAAELAEFFQELYSFPFPVSSALASASVAINIYCAGHWLLGVAVCYWCMHLLTLRFRYLVARIEAGTLSLQEIRATHTRACDLIDAVDDSFQHFTTVWIVVGWALIIFLLYIVLLVDVGYIMWTGAIFWLVSGVGLQGVLAISAAVLQANHQRLTNTLIATNQGLDDKLELFALLTRLKAIQPGMTALFRAVPMDWRFLLTVGSTVSSAFVLLNQIQKYGARAATSQLTSSQ